MRHREVKNVVVSVFRRPQRDAEPEESRQIFLRAGLGIDGDCHARSTSPRQVLLVATGTYARFDIAPCSLRENILINVDELKLSSGDLLLIGHDVALRVCFKCEPCARLNRFRDKLSRDIKGSRGYLARVVRSGLVHPGDGIKVVKNVFRSFPDKWRERVIDVVRMVPPDEVVSYAQLAELAGVPKSFCRAFPRLLRSQGDIQWQRIIKSLEVNETNCKLNRLGNELFQDEVSFISEGESPSQRSS
jgi:alkylated DNA nucleotide flippase Atl1